MVARTSKERIVIIDGHIIIQFCDDTTGWWTWGKTIKNDESDYAMWIYDQTNLKKASNLVGNVPIRKTDKKPVLSARGWTSEASNGIYYPNTSDGYREALRELARNI